MGLELLATKLGEIPQANELSVSFHAHAGRATDIEHKRRNGEYYPILAARFHHSRMGLSECTAMQEHGFYDPHWNIAVYAVSRTNRAIAKKLLSEQGIPAVVAWLQRPRNETWLQGRKEIAVCFNEKDQTIIVETKAE
jgi:hypothetical protein